MSPRRLPPLRTSSLAVALALPGCAKPPQEPVVLHVAAAASLREPLETLAARYRGAHANIDVRFSFGASGDLATQIARGAPAALFASAAAEPITQLSHHVTLTSLCPLAGNELVLIRGRDASLADLRWETLATHPALAHLALGVAPSVPAGVYAEQSLRALGVLDALGPKLVRGGNVRQVLDLVARGEAEAGVVYATDVRGRGDVTVVGLPPAHARPTVRYTLAWMRDTGNAAEARVLGDWLCGPEGRRVFEAHGFRAP